MKLSSDAATRISKAVEAAEQKTAVEVVVTVLPRSAAYLGAAALAGVLAGLVALAAVLLVEDVEFGPELVVPITGTVGILAFSLLAFGPARWRSTAAARAKAVDTQAHAAFSRHGVYRTSGRTGLLVFLSLDEREARVLGDQAVASRVPGDVRADWQARLSAVAGRFSAEALAAELEALGARAGAYLPRQEDDVDELPNAPHTEEAS